MNELRLNSYIIQADEFKIQIKLNQIPNRSCRCRVLDVHSDVVYCKIKRKNTNSESMPAARINKTNSILHTFHIHKYP